MSKKGNKNDIWKLITSSQAVVLTTHVRPDGDGIASELALYRILKSLKKDVYILNQDKTPEMYAWLPGAENIITLEKEDIIELRSVDLTVLLDCSSRDRIGAVYEYVKDSKKIISLDHHEDSDCWGGSCYVDTKASSIGELLFYLIPDVKQHLDQAIATCIYASILTDTGSFAFANTTKRVFQIVTTLMDYGVKPDYTFQMIYNQKSIRHFRLLGKALERLETDESGRIVWVILPLSVYRETGALDEDNEGILEVIRGLRNCELVIMLRQLDRDRVKGSLRSTNHINCNHLAKFFSGGGHLKASGFVVRGDINEIGPSIVRKIMGEVKDQGWM